MGNISGNHDLTRFISLSSGDIDRNEDPKIAGWTRDIQVTDTIGYARLKLLHAWNYAIPGIPILFYGDEIGIPGGNDPDNRRMMYFEGWNRYEKGVHDLVQKLNTYRSNHMSLIFGDWRVIETSKDYLVAERHYNDEITRVYLNKSNTSHIFTLPCKEACVTDLLHMQSPGDLIDLEPYSFQYLTYRICD
jgi:glycosidase